MNPRLVVYIRISNTFSRILWVTLFSISIGVCCVLMKGTLKKFNQAPIILSLDGQYHDIQSVGDNRVSQIF